MQLAKNIEILERALVREKAARKAAEAILEQKSLELYNVSEELRQTNSILEETLNRKTSELEGVFETLIDAFIVMELSGDVIKMNQAAKDLLGFDPEEEHVNLIGLVKDQYKEYTFEAFKELTIHGKFNNYRAVIITKNGDEKIVQINASIIYNTKGEPVAAQGIARDITQETAMKRQMQHQKRQLDIIFGNSPIGVSLARSMDGGLLMVNSAMSKMFGYTPEEFEKVDVNQITHPDHREETLKLREKLFAGEIQSFQMEKRYFKKDGSLLWANTSVTAVPDENGVTEYLVATVEDITERKEASNKLKQSENRMSTLIMNMQSAVLLEDENRTISLTNQRFCDLFEIPAPPAALTGADCSSAAEQSKRLFAEPENFVLRIKKLLEKRETVIGEEIEMADGRYLERSYIPIFSDGIYKGHLWSYDDITIRKRYKESLKAQKEKYSNIIANMNLGLLEVDNNDHIIMANQSFQHISGYTEKELKGKHPADLLLTDESKQLLETIEDHKKTGITTSYEITVFNKTGEKRTWIISGTPNYNMQGEMIGSILIHLDITDRKDLENKQVELLKDLEVQNQELNDYAHIVSHDLKSPLRNISALLSWTKEDFRNQLGEDSLVNIDLMQDKVEKMDHLIENILKYSSIDRSSASVEKVDVQALVEDIIAMIYIPDHIQVTIKNKLPVIQADTTRIQQLFQNIISNAVNYIDKEQGIVEVDVEENAMEYIFSVQDNGIGIPEDQHDRIFQIFNTASDHKKSTGIGLSIVRKIIDLYDGKVWLESKPGIGTTFNFSIKKSL
ncbi:PAS domain S-box-containing protein [Gramella sp. Hel_I_59]|uniref:PAS domain-containing sensor histidine kinase n=1 Tax=Gramella sp. Hel_I_59 TaxID=1249978 RepID=UPI001152E244|nr:PAS domain S-box protein [Gramella sp. Hel_I_59]TQI71318.1 PAS domain S-box-containing protein [Gramella sp. Hel_I_59]